MLSCLDAREGHPSRRKASAERQGSIQISSIALTLSTSANATSLEDLGPGRQLATCSDPKTRVLHKASCLQPTVALDLSSKALTGSPRRAALDLSSKALAASPRTTLESPSGKTKFLVVSRGEAGFRFKDVQ